MIPKNEVIEFARLQNVEPRIIEKDYVLGWLLAGINQHPLLKGKWIFKGGTCLKKCYFETFRFSEDLDYTVTDETHINIDFLNKVLPEILAWVSKHTGLELPIDRIKLNLHPDIDKKYVEARIYYVGPLNQRSTLARIILDISANEILVLPPIEQEIYHPYSDRPNHNFTALCYKFEEVFAEKIRAMAERARQRDLYDIFHLYHNKELVTDKPLLIKTLQQKCDFKSISFPSNEMIKNHRLIAELYSEWHNMLAHQLPLLPSIDIFMQELPLFFDWLENDTKTKAIDIRFPVIEDIDQSWQADCRIINLNKDSGKIIKIQFAIANRLNLEFIYRKSKYLVSPHNIIKTNRGVLYLEAIESSSLIATAFEINIIEKLLLKSSIK